MNDQSLRDHLLELLRSGHAHVTLDDAVADFPLELRGVRPGGAAHSGWEILEHLRLAQWDILEFSRDAKHVSPAWPKGYWPESPEPPDSHAWDRSAAAFRADLQALQDLVADPATDLFARIPHGTGQTILREVLLVADHNAYHLGELVLLRRLLGNWPAPS
jgi:uncharacterized damage-inducible protein DinB